MLALVLLIAYPAVSPRGAVAAANPLAAESGAAILRRGGNAIDAAVAAAFTLAVVEPESSGLAGGGFAVLYTVRDKQVHVIDFRETGPARAKPDMYILNGQARQDLANAGPLSVAVPTAVKGYVELVKRFGTQPLSLLTSAAEQLARRGFQVDLHFHRASEERLECLAADAEASRLFLRKDKDGDLISREPGERLLQPELSRTLHAIGERGADAFYKGRIARQLVDAVKSKGGILELEDLSRVQVRERVP